MVDHRVAPKGDMTLFRDKSNWQPFNSSCNTRKAILSEGAFGRPAKGGGGQKPSEGDKDRQGDLARTRTEKNGGDLHRGPLFEVV